jgi:hypothetical protein
MALGMRALARGAIAAAEHHGAAVMFCTDVAGSEARSRSVTEDRTRQHARRRAGSADGNLFAAADRNAHFDI